VEKKFEIIDKIIEIEIYLYIILMFVTKGEGIRNILLFSSFLLWLATLKYRKSRWILREPISIFFWGFTATIVVSAIFSIDPLYSFKTLRGEPLKSVIIFCLISTVLSDEKRLKKFIYLSFFLLVFTISVGYYSYWAYDLPLMKPVTPLRHAWHSRFAMDINALLPFTFILLLITKDMRFKIIRGGLAALLSILVIWLTYMLKKYRVNIKIMLASVVILAVLSGSILYSSPNIKQRFSNLGHDITTLNERTEIWGPLIFAAAEKPFFGWGYGPEIFVMDKPFENTPFVKAPVHIKPAFRNPHNSFLKIFFHQGIIGLISYIALLIVATRTFWKGAYSTNNLKSYIIMACTSIMVGTFFVNSIVENPHLTDLTFILGIGLATKNLGKEDR
jgi:hypothetical protein